MDISISAIHLLLEILGSCFTTRIILGEMQSPKAKVKRSDVCVCVCRKRKSQRDRRGLTTTGRKRGKESGGRRGWWDAGCRGNKEGRRRRGLHAAAAHASRAPPWSSRAIRN